MPWGSRVDARGAGGADLRRIRIPPLPRAVSIPKAIATPAASARLSDSIPLPSGLHLASPLQHVHIHLLRFRRKANTGLSLTGVASNLATCDFDALTI